MADKRITDVDFLDSLNSDESFFVNQNNAIKQINKSNIVFDASTITSGTLLSDRLPVTPISKGGTGATDADTALMNLGAVNKAGDTMTGMLCVPSPFRITGATYPAIDVYTTDINTAIGGVVFSASDRRFYFTQYNTDMDGDTARYKENFCLPKPDSGLTETKWYSILSNKTPVTVAQGGTGSSNGATGLKNLFAAGSTILSSYQYGDTLPSDATVGRVFLKKI